MLTSGHTDKLEVGAQNTLIDFLSILGEETKAGIYSRIVDDLNKNISDMHLLHWDRDLSYVRRVELGAICVVAYDLDNEDGKREFEAVPKEGHVLFEVQGGRKYGIREKSIPNSVGLVTMGWL